MTKKRRSTVIVLEPLADFPVAPVADWAAAAGDSFLVRYFREYLLLVDTRRWAQIVGMALVSHLLEPSREQARLAVDDMLHGRPTEWLAAPRRWVRDCWTPAHWRTVEDLACAQAHMTLGQHLDPVLDARSWEWAIEDRAILGAVLTMLRVAGYGTKLESALGVLDRWAECELAVRPDLRQTSEWSRRVWLRVVDTGWHTPEEGR